MRTILHIDFNSFFATLEQQANPNLRGKPVGVTGGDRDARTVLATISVEGKRLGLKTGMQIWEAKKICPEIIIVRGDSDKYLYVTKKFLNILKDYSPNIEVFSIDESFLELPFVIAKERSDCGNLRKDSHATLGMTNSLKIAQEVKQRIKSEIGEWVTCSIGISYNKLMAKLASSLKKPDGLVVIPDQEEAIKVLDRVQLDDICGIGSRIKKRLFDMGITNFKKLRAVPKECLVASFKSYGEVLFNMARGIDERLIVKFFEKEEVKSIGHRHTIFHDTSDVEEIRQILLKISEMVAVRLREKNLGAKTINVWYRSSFNNSSRHPEPFGLAQGGLVSGSRFLGDGMQKSMTYSTNDGLKIFQVGLGIFNSIWSGEKIRMIGLSASNLKLMTPSNLTFLAEENRQKIILETLDKINHKFGDFTLKRGILLGSENMRRKPNPYLSDRRFKI